MSRCTFHDLHHEKASDTQHIRLISEGGCSLSRSPGPICIDSIQVSQTCIMESHHTLYRSATGACTICPTPGNFLFFIPSEHAAELDQGVFPMVLRTRFAQQGIELSEHPEIRVQHEGRLWVVNDQKQHFAVRKLATHLAIFKESC
jgi:hypothetical protein